MLLRIAALLLAVGFATWLIGEYFSYTGIASIGAGIVLIVGGAVVLSGLEYRTGAIKTASHTVVNNTTVVNETSISYEYETADIGAIFGVGILGSLGIGGVLMLLGATLLSRTLAEEA